MRRARQAIAVALAVGLVGVTTASATTRTIKVTSVSVRNVVRDVGAKGASAGDTVTFRDRLVNAVGGQFGKKKGEAIGSDSGKLTFVSARAATFKGTATLPGGTFVLAGTVSPRANGGFAIPIVGGTGKFAHAHGTVTVGPQSTNVLNVYVFSTSTGLIA